MRSFNDLRSVPLLLAALALALASCTTIQLISKYDEQTDAAATSLQRDMTAYLVGIASEPDPEKRSFDANLDFHRQAAVNFSALEIRAGAIYKNGTTAGQIALTHTSFAWLILMHKGCVTGPLSEEQRAKVDSQGPDLSLACRTSYGASLDAPDRGRTPLSPAVARLAQRQFDQQLGAIIALELAKKRGERKD